MVFFVFLKLSKSILDIFKMSILRKGRPRFSKKHEKMTCDHYALILDFLENSCEHNFFRQIYKFI